MANLFLYIVCCALICGVSAQMVPIGGDMMGFQQAAAEQNYYNLLAQQQNQQQYQQQQEQQQEQAAVYGAVYDAGVAQQQYYQQAYQQPMMQPQQTQQQYPPQQMMYPQPMYPQQPVYQQPYQDQGLVNGAGGAMNGAMNGAMDEMNSDTGIFANTKRVTFNAANSAIDMARNGATDLRSNFVEDHQTAGIGWIVVLVFAVCVLAGAVVFGVIVVLKNRSTRRTKEESIVRGDYQAPSFD